jgi:hypothetical protein
MNEEAMREAVSKSLAAKDAQPAPGFDETWLAAEGRYLAWKRRQRTFIGVAASVALFAVLLSVMPPDEQVELPDFEIAAGMMNSTQWSAPSDVLMPEYSIDIYGELPQLPGPTDIYEGTLL